MPDILILKQVILDLFDLVMVIYTYSYSSWDNNVYYYYYSNSRTISIYSKTSSQPIKPNQESTAIRIAAAKDTQTDCDIVHVRCQVQCKFQFPNLQNAVKISRNELNLYYRGTFGG